MELEKLTELAHRVSAELQKLQITDPGERFGPDSAEDRVDSVLRRLTEDAPEETQRRMRSEYLGYGPLETLLNDTTTTEILVNGPDAIWVERQGRLQRHSDHFFSDLTYRNSLQRICREAEIQTNLDCPFTDGQWLDFRVHLATPPVSGSQSVLTLRRHPANPWTLSRLEETGWAETSALQALRQLIERRKNFLIVGSTGSGKTSVLNACLQEIPPNERAVLIEDTSELNAPNPASVKLLTRKDANGQLRDIDQAELLKQSLRMRPDRIVMGEIRGAEAKDLLMAFATGHAGCLGTLHADDARQALLRLEMLIQIGASQWSLQAVRTLIHLSLDGIVVVGRTPGGARRLKGIYKIVSLEDVGFLLERLV